MAKPTRKSLTRGHAVQGHFGPIIPVVRPLNEEDYLRVALYLSLHTSPALGFERNHLGKGVRNCPPEEVGGSLMAGGAPYDQ